MLCLQSDATRFSGLWTGVKVAASLLLSSSETDLVTLPEHKDKRLERGKWSPVLSFPSKFPFPNQVVSTPWVHILALLLTSSVSLHKEFSEPQLLHLGNWENNNPCLEGILSFIFFKLS